MFQTLESKYPKFYQFFRLFVVVMSSILFAWNLCCFAKTANLFPGGFAGLSLLLQEIIFKFLHIKIPYTIFNIVLNLFPIYIAFKYIGKKFTLYSILTIFLSSIFVDILPHYIFTQDILLVSVFGGLINGFAISLCLNVGATTGGTDFISIFLSQQKGIDAWNYILLGNAIMLIVAGALFGWPIALYSIIYQFCSTQVIQMLYKRYKKETLFIISDKSDKIYHAIKELTNHDATLFKGIGCYEEKEKTLIYSVINAEAKRQLIPLIRSIDPHAFINIVKTEELSGRFHNIPND
ncbi:MAG: YitT family protein [Lachnospiraceae bacterium]|nr:YitT family protein [Clostridiales bacterium]MDD6292574.1 YitT family protein [Eubacteriales bacterium]MDY2606916.1 YitT family protein [Lachnospiraceae bacterium]